MPSNPIRLPRSCSQMTIDELVDRVALEVDSSTEHVKAGLCHICGHPTSAAWLVVLMVKGKGETERRLEKPEFMAVPPDSDHAKTLQELSDAGELVAHSEDRYMATPVFYCERARDPEVWRRAMTAKRIKEGVRLGYLNPDGTPKNSETTKSKPKVPKGAQGSWAYRKDMQ